MRFLNHRTIILALIVTILVLILIRNGAPLAADQSALAATSTNPEVSAPTYIGSGIQDANNPNIAILPSAPLVAPVPSPLYTQLKYDRQQMNIADYTGVPINISGPMKCTEDPTTFIVDRKYAPITNGAIRLTDRADLITNVNRDLAIAMAGLNEDCGPCATQNKTPDGVWKMWNDLPVFIRGLIIEKSRTTNDKLNQDFNDQNMSNPDIQAGFDANITFVSKLPVDICCTDMEDNCKAWALNNQCITNPAYMLQNCPRSCGSCKMSTSQIAKLTRLDLTLTPPNCASSDGGIVA